MTKLAFSLMLALIVLGASGCRRNSDFAWRFSTPRPWFRGGDSEALNPAVMDRTVFFCGGHGSDGQAAIYALDLQTGRTKWREDLGDCVAAPLVTAGTVVAFGSADEGSRIVVHAIDPESGRDRWHVDLPGNPHPPAPVVVGDFVFFAPGSRSVLRIDVRGGSVQSFDVDADVTVPAEALWIAAGAGEALFGYGTSFWRSRIGSDSLEAGPELADSVGRPVGTAIDGETLLAADDQGTLRAFDLEKGSVIWLRHWSKIRTPPVIADGKAFLNVYLEKNILAAVSMSSGQELWQVEGASAQIPEWQNGRVYETSGRDMRVIDAESGRVGKRVSAPTQIVTAAVPTSGLILFGTAQGILYAAKAQ